MTPSASASPMMTEPSCRLSSLRQGRHALHAGVLHVFKLISGSTFVDDRRKFRLLAIDAKIKKESFDVLPRFTKSVKSPDR